MRASRSCPRSSVPNGWAQDGASRCALKSISLIGTRQTTGPNATANTINTKTTMLATAGRCRRNRRQVSVPGETRRARAMPSCPALAVGNARVEPAIEHVGDQVEQDDEAGEDKGDRHDHRRVVRQYRAADADDIRRRDQGHHRDQSVADNVLDHDDALGEPLRASRRDIVEADHVEDRRAHIACPRGSLKQAKHGDWHYRLAKLLPIPTPACSAEIAAENEGQPVEINAEEKNEQN